MNGIEEVYEESVYNMDLTWYNSPEFLKAYLTLIEKAEKEKEIINNIC